MINLLDDTANEPPKFRTTNYVETIDESQGACSMFLLWWYQLKKI